MANRSGSGCPASVSAASRSPAGHPSVRPCSRARAGPDRSDVGGLEQRACLGEAEAQVDGADLAELALQPQPVQVQAQVLPGQQHEPQLRRRAHDHQFQLAQRIVPGQLVHVVDDQPHGLARTRRGPRAGARRSPSRRGPARSAVVPTPIQPRWTAARRQPRSRTAGYSGPHPFPRRRRRAEPCPTRRSTSAAETTYRSRPGPTPWSPARCRAARTAGRGTRPRRPRRGLLEPPPSRIRRGTCRRSRARASSLRRGRRWLRPWNSRR